MIRALTSILWLIAALALGFEAAAQPCDMRAQIDAVSHHEMMADMPCHDGKSIDAPDHEQAPDHHENACCCAALLGNGVTVEPTLIAQPLPGITLWSSPLPANARSIIYEYDPPPPRA